MKNLFYFITFMLGISLNLQAQSIPQRINYQAVVRDSSNGLLIGDTVGLEFRYKYCGSCVVVHIETFLRPTNQFGLINLELGGGTPVFNTFDSIDWCHNAVFLEVGIDPTGGSNFIPMDTTQFLSVPYAFCSGQSQSAWNLLGNTGTIDGVNFLGTIDTIPMNFRVGNEKAGRISNSAGTVTFFGYHSGNVNTGGLNSAFGHEALMNNINGLGNTASGYQALYLGITGSFNTAVGVNALRVNTGNSNTAIGNEALVFNTTGFSNTAIGRAALFYNTTRSNLVAIGDSALFNNGIGATGILMATGNTAVGSRALQSNNIGYRNVALGTSALQANTSGNWNTAIGAYSLYSNISGTNNTCIGSNALRNNDFGYNNCAIGSAALFNNAGGRNNTATGILALNKNTSGDNNSAHGAWALEKNTIGTHNTANGFYALNLNDLGISNTANGAWALENNTSGQHNTAIGSHALQSNISGNKNTTVGTFSDVSSGSLTNATAIGYNAKVSTSNSLVLGGTGAYAVKVGIGTSAPQRTLHLNGAMRFEPLNAAPANASGGDAYYDAVSHKLKVFDGTVWRNCW
jgi:trimeric autotransporter adhesin